MKYIIVFALLLCSVLANGQNENSEVKKPMEVPDGATEVPFAIIEQVPIYAGCDKTMDNRALKKCMSDKITKVVLNNFNIDVAEQLDLESGQVRISVIFKIDTLGNVVSIKARAPKIELEQEAIRVVKLIPRMTPGYQKGNPVVVPYSLPIVFNYVNPNYGDSELSYPVFRGCNEDLSYKNQKKCTSKKVTNFVKMSFNTELANTLFPQDKSTQFQVDFVINKKGKAVKINAKAHKREIAVEAINILKRLPKFKKPGYKNGKAVDTPFSLLITIYFD